MFYPKNGSWNAEETVRAERSRSMNGVSAFTNWVLPQSPFTLRQALGERALGTINCLF